MIFYGFHTNIILWNCSKKSTYAAKTGEGKTRNVKVAGRPEYVDPHTTQMKYR
jgi:hypothetical protein